MTSPIAPARQRLERAYLYLITPARPPAGSLDEFLPLVLEGGVDMVQLRDKEMEGGHLLGASEVIRRRTEEFGALFIVNDRVDVALAAGADGVHLGQDDLPAQEARRLGGAAFIVGLSTHAPGEIEAAESSEADYIGVGPVYSTPTKRGRPAVGTSLVEAAASRFARPFFAIGGIDERTLPEVIEAGARRVSVLRALTEASDPLAAARSFARILEDARASV